MLIYQMNTYFDTSKTHKNRCPCLSIKWLPTFIAPNLIKKGVHFLSLKLVPILIAPNLIKIGANAYL